MSWSHPLYTAAGWLARKFPPQVKNALYRIKPLARLIRGTLNRAAPLGLTQVQVAAGGLAGAELSLDLQSEKDYWLGTYERELQQAVADWVEPGMVVYDVGANIGYISLLLARYVGDNGVVFAFEALPANLERLHTNLKLNGLEPRVQVVAGAVADHDRPVRFQVGPSNGMGKVEGSAGRKKGDYKETFEVPGITLDTFVYHNGNPPPEVIKMDIEGGEVLALPGMRRLLLEQRPILLLEIHGPEAARVAWGILKEAGYRIDHMRPGYPVIGSPDSMKWISYVLARSID